MEERKKYECPVCENGSEIIYRINEHDRKQNNLEDNFYRLEEKIDKRIGRLEKAIWGLLTSSIVLLMSTVITLV